MLQEIAQVFSKVVTKIKYTSGAHITSNLANVQTPGTENGPIEDINYSQLHLKSL